MNIVILEPLAISRADLDALMQPLAAEGHTFTVYDNRGTQEEQMQRVTDADVLVLANMPLPAEVIAAAPRLKFIDVAFTGVDHIALDAARERGIAVSNASGYSTNAVAELALGMMLSLLRNIPQVEQRCRDGETKDGLVGFELRGKTVGIVGPGAIGRRTAQLCAAFGAHVLASSRTRTSGTRDGLKIVPLEELLRESDIVSLHCPLTDETQDLLGEEQIRMMKPGALLINAARGPVVNTDALVKALGDGRLAGAGIDVFEMEPPLPLEHPLLHTPNTIVTPHVAFATRESLKLRADIVFHSLEQWLQGNQINVIL